MEILPAVDVMGGECVQLVQGERERATRYGDPLACARRWIGEGAAWLHVINLDGAFGQSRANAEVAPMPSPAAPNMEFTQAGR